MVEICVIVFPAKSICHSNTSAEARGAKASDVKLWPGIFAKYFLKKTCHQRKLRQTF